MTEKTCVTNDGYIAAAQKQADAIMVQAQVDVAIQVAMALWQRNTSSDVASMQEEIAKRHMVLAEAIQDHTEQFWPQEERLVNDAMDEATPSYSPQGFAVEATNNTLQLIPASESFASGQTTDQCIVFDEPYAVRIASHLRREATDMSSHWGREAVHINDTVGDRRFARQYQVLSMGRELIGDVISYNSAGGGAGVMAGGMLEGTLQGFADAVQYDGAARGPGQWGAAIREALTGPPPEDSMAQTQLRNESIAAAKRSLPAYNRSR